MSHPLFKSPVRLLLLLGLLLTPALADQNDARLDPLFERLQQAPDALTSSIIEQQIWRLWTEAPSEDAEALMRRGTRAMQEGELTRAVHFFDELIEQAPDFAEGWNKRATVHYMLGQYQRSISDIEKTLELEPRHFGALSGLGAIFARLDQPEAAIRAFEEVLELYPQSRSSRRSIRRLEEEMLGRII